MEATALRRRMLLIGLIAAIAVLALAILDHVAHGGSMAIFYHTRPVHTAIFYHTSPFR